MQSVGQYLRELRVARGVSLEELARTTRVGHRYLEAIEADAFDRLPAPVFAKGFIRAWCVALGEPPDEALARFCQMTASAPPEPAPSLTLRPQARARTPVLVSLVLLVVLGLGLFFLTLALERRTTEAPVRPEAVALPAASAPARPPSPAAAARPREPSPRARLVARATEPTWVRVEMDDGSVAQELLPAGATREWFSAKRFVLTVGNAGGVSLELNGEPIPPLGARGAVIRDLVIPADPGATRP